MVVSCAMTSDSVRKRHPVSYLTGAEQAAVSHSVLPCTIHGSTFRLYMGSCQNYGPFLGTLNIRCRIIIRTQKGSLILTTTHMLRLGALLVLQSALHCSVASPFM